MISPRYAPALCALMAVALVPTLIHSYAGATVNDGRTTAMIPTMLAGSGSAPTGERDATWGQRRFESNDWFQRTYMVDSNRVMLSVVRSYDLKSLYHHPELAVAYGTSYVGQEVRRFDQRPELPVHVLTPNAGVSSHGLYVLHYDDRFVEDPIWFQLRTAGELLFGPRKPMTLLFVQDFRSAEEEPKAALTILFSAIDAFVNGTHAGAAQ